MNEWNEDITKKKLDQIQRQARLLEDFLQELGTARPLERGEYWRLRQRIAIILNLTYYPHQDIDWTGKKYMTPDPEDVNYEDNVSSETSDAPG